MKPSKSNVQSKTHSLPDVKFENQALTSFAGLILLQKFFAAINLKQHLQNCFLHLNNGKVFNRALIFLQLVVHVILGYRELQDSRYYRDDPLIKRLLGLNQLPDVATLSRALKQADAESVAALRSLLRDLVFERLQILAPMRITLDFDGSVQSTQRRAEGTAVGFNKKKKGARSYYPLFCTLAQTGQVIDFLHRPGNVHDSKGAQAFILACIDAVRAVAPQALIEVRMDSAFFSDEIIDALEDREVEFTLSVPFERFVNLKSLIDQRRRWHRLSGEASYFETRWKPACWDRRFRFIFIRTKTKKQQKGPVQLDLFVPYDTGYDFKVIVTNKTLSAKRLAAYHEGRGSQEGIFAELKSHCHQDYIPVRSKYGNQTYLLAGLIAHNLMRELQMQTTKPSRGTTAKRASLWVFEKVDTIRKTLIQRAGRLTRPKNALTLTISANAWIEKRFMRIFNAIPGVTTT
ncbi:MAG: IS1380 family transposase [Nitrospinaceae bacterium]|nr:IS1380 family transposase [Nitrospinaceae bacterium]